MAARTLPLMPSPVHGASAPRLEVTGAPAYLDLKRLAARLSVSPRTIRAWAADPASPLPCYRVGRGKLLFRLTDVDRFLDRHRVQPLDSNAIATSIVNALAELS